MRRRWAVAGLMGMVASLVGTMVPARAASGPNWVEVKLVLPRDAHSVEFSIQGSGSGTFGGPSAFGDGISWPGGHTLFVGSDGGPNGISTTQQLGGLQLQLSKPATGHGGFFSTFGFGGKFHAGDVLTNVLFETSMSFDQVQASAAADGLSVPLTITQGSGAGVVGVADPANGGAGVASPFVSGGIVTATAAPSSGVIGGLMTDCYLGPCAFTWQSPDGRSGTYTSVSAGAVGVSATPAGTFAGPAGQWQWSFAGTDRGGAIAAYAPIGADWAAYK